MRIPCAKCGHVHDSTVTPFMHDIIKVDIVPTSPAINSRIAVGAFECGNCGNENLVALTWTVINKEGEGKTRLEEILEEEELANVPEDTDRVF